MATPSDPNRPGPLPGLGPNRAVTLGSASALTGGAQHRHSQWSTIRLSAWAASSRSWVAKTTVVPDADVSYLVTTINC